MIERVVRFLTHQSGTKVVSIVIAVVLWFIVIWSRTVEVTKEVPLEIVTSSDFVVANDVPDSIGFRLAGPKAFLRAVLDRKETPIRVNLTGSKSGVVTYRFFSDSIRVPLGVKVAAINPTAVSIKLEPTKRKEVPIRLETRGSVPESVRLLKSELKPARVKVRGAESRIEALDEIPTLPVDLTDVREDVVRAAPLDIGRTGVTIEGPQPQVFIDVEAQEPSSTAANFKIKNVDIRVQSSYKFKLMQPTVTVFVRAEPEVLRALDRKQVYATIDLRGRGKGTYTERLKVSVPDGVTFVRSVPEDVTITLGD